MGLVGAKSKARNAHPTGVDEYVLGSARVHLFPTADPLGDEPTATVWDGLLVVVHGLLDYREKLASELAAEGMAGPDTKLNHSPPAEVVARAYRCWGGEMTDRLEGDFCAVVWDRNAQCLFAFRSNPGPYPLYYAATAGARPEFVLADTIGGVLSHPAVREDLNAAAIAESAGGLLFGEHGETCRQAVQVLNPGWALTRQNDAPPQRFRSWCPSVRTDNGPRSSGASHLLELLRDSVRERASTDGPTAVWLSGGYDSSAVFAAAMSTAGLATNGNILPVSISYPEGDPGREDEWIEATARRWGTSPRWIDSEAIAVRARIEDSAGRRDAPFVHLFDTWNEALAIGARAAGAGVALGGDGGDQLFQAPPIHLSDSVRKGRVLAAIREYRTLGGRTPRGWIRWAILPLVPRRIARFYEGFRATPFPDTLRMGAPAWFRKPFVEHHRLLERNREAHPDFVGRSRAAWEVFRLASSPFFGRVAAEVRVAARRHGVLHRSPLWDRRIVEFALERPFAERVQDGLSKILLRQSMEGLVPEEVLAPRSRRTGAPDQFFYRLMKESILPAIDRLGPPGRLADLGILEPSEFSQAVARYRAAPSFFEGARIGFTVDTESWLRSLG